MTPATADREARLRRSLRHQRVCPDRRRGRSLLQPMTMTRRTAIARHIGREEAGCIDFDAALEAYLDGGAADELLRASALVMGSSIPLDEERAEIIAVITGCPYVLADYDDAARAVQRWFATMAEPGARH